MIANFIAYWLIGLPLGYLLAFRIGWGALGVWIGLCIGLVIIGSALIMTWRNRVLRVSTIGIDQFTPEMSNANTA